MPSSANSRGSPHGLDLISANAAEPLGQPVVLVGYRQKFHAFLRLIKGIGLLFKGIGLLSQVSRRVSISTGPILGRLGGFHLLSRCWVDPNRSLTLGSAVRL